MNPQDLSVYITNLLRSGPEVIASFFVGVCLTAMAAFALRRLFFSSRGAKKKIALKDAEITRKDAEIAWKEAQLIKVEAKLATLEGILIEKVELFSVPTHQKPTFPLTSGSAPPAPAEFATLKACCARLEVENLQLVQTVQSQEQTIEGLRTELAKVSGELAHAAKWLKIFDEENARLTESGWIVEH